MSATTNVDRGAALRTPEKVFRHPLEVLHCVELTESDRVAVLRNWKQSLEQLQSASDENMPNQTGSSDVSEMLSAVTNALVELENPVATDRESQVQ
jgi:hypothetical protein